MTEQVLEVLTEGNVELEGRLITASNATFVGTCTLDGASVGCVYKPVRGERPLWDFPDGTLAARERASYLVSEATGWGLVPPTVLRDGPFGPGMCQLWIEVDPEVELVDIVAVGDVPAGWIRILDAEDQLRQAVSLVHADHPDLRRMCVLDAVLNNADRKGGHVLVDERGTVYGVDHGVCLSAEPKLRTVLWGWTGQPLDEEHNETLRGLAAQLAAELGERLSELLDPAELAAARRRIAALLREGCFPRPPLRWPAIPWPAF